MTFLMLSLQDIRGGQAAILVYEGTIQAMRRLESQNWRRRTAIADYVAPADRSMTVEVQYSSFEVRSCIFCALFSLL